MEKHQETFLAFLQKIDADFSFSFNTFSSINSEFSFLFIESDGDSIPFTQNNKTPFNNHQVITIFAHQWANNQAIIKSRIYSLFGKNTTIHGRKTLFKRIDKAIAQPFLDENHLQGYVNSKLKYGLYSNGELLAVATFSAGRKMNDKTDPYRSFELIRFANKLNINVVGGLSKLIKSFAKTHNAGNVMTYVDAAWSTGQSFKKLGFMEKGKLEPMLITAYNGQKKVDFFNAGSHKLIWENPNYNSQLSV
jgi:hypothetical protein